MTANINKVYEVQNVQVQVQRMASETAAENLQREVAIYNYKVHSLHPSKWNRDHIQLAEPKAKGAIRLPLTNQQIFSSCIVTDRYTVTLDPFAYLALILSGSLDLLYLICTFLSHPFCLAIFHILALHNSRRRATYIGHWLV